MITHLLFDHDGVLVDTEKRYFEATREALARLNVIKTFDDYKRHLVDGMSNWAGAAATGATEAEIVTRVRGEMIATSTTCNVRLLDGMAFVLCREDYTRGRWHSDDQSPQRVRGASTGGVRLFDQVVAGAA